MFQPSVKIFLFLGDNIKESLRNRYVLILPEQEGFYGLSQDDAVMDRRKIPFWERQMAL
jgi:hypothetical protein